MVIVKQITETAVFPFSEVQNTEDLLPLELL